MPLTDGRPGPRSGVECCHQEVCGMSLVVFLSLGFDASLTGSTLPLALLPPSITLLRAQARSTLMPVSPRLVYYIVGYNCSASCLQRLDATVRTASSGHIHRLVKASPRSAFHGKLRCIPWPVLPSAAGWHLVLRTTGPWPGHYAQCVDSQRRSPCVSSSLRGDDAFQIGSNPARTCTSAFIPCASPLFTRPTAVQNL